MNTIRQLILGLLMAPALGVCNNIDQTKQLSATVNSDASIQQVSLQSVNKEKVQPYIQQKEKRPKSDFKTVEWIDLMPKEDLDAQLNPPSYITDIIDGSIEDQISSQIQNSMESSIEAANQDRYQQALASTIVVPEMTDKAIRIPGFIVPVEFDDQQIITQFFLVPFFGACLHLPPPPPNQIIFVNYPEGIKLDALYDPFWISGVLKTSLIENKIATATYSLDMQYFEEYRD